MEWLAGCSSLKADRIFFLTLARSTISTRLHNSHAAQSVYNRYIYSEHFSEEFIILKNKFQSKNSISTNLKRLKMIEATRSSVHTI